MAKACDCSAILEAYETDPRLLSLPLAVRGLWLALVLRMRRMGQSVLVLGSVVPNLRDIAMLVPMAETELETQLDALLARGLLVRREDGALESPLLAARLKRAETARINGLKGGRPRKDGAPPGQRSLIMGLPGGAAEAGAKTQAEPSAAPVGLPAKLAEALPERSKLAELPADWQRIADAAMEAAGFDPARWTGHCGQVATWLKAGASEALILRVIRRVMARGSARPGHFGYFDKAVRAAMEAEGEVRVASVPVVDPAREARAREFNQAVARWQANGCAGPMPVWEAAA
jgi:hypothetical protein